MSSSVCVPLFFKSFPFSEMWAASHSWVPSAKKIMITWVGRWGQVHWGSPGPWPPAQSSLVHSHPFPSVQMSLFSNLCCLMGFPGGSAGKESVCNVGHLGSVPELGRFSEEGNSYPRQYSGLENSIDCIVYRVTRNRTRLSDFHFNSVSGQGGTIHLCHFEQALILSGPQFLLHNKREVPELWF